MSNDPAVVTLASWLTRPESDLPPAGKNLFAGARYNPVILDKFKGEYVQSFFPYVNELRVNGIECTKTIEQTGDEFQAALYLPGQQKLEILCNFAAIFSKLASGAPLACCLSNSLGAARFERHLCELFGNVESWSKNKCRVFWSVKNDETANGTLLSEWTGHGAMQQVEGTSLKSRPGIFAWDRIDQGSELLAGCLPDDLAGRGADLGCGYGYLSEKALSSGRVTEMHLLDAEYRAIEAARINLERFSGSCRLIFNWADVTRGIDTENLDWIITNPPFHIGKTTDPGIGERFIKSAAGALKPGGRLFLVCNVKLPYERVMQDNFSTCTAIARENGFKVLSGIK